jgi:hypothetical protein
MQAISSTRALRATTVVAASGKVSARCSRPAKPGPLPTAARPEHPDRPRPPAAPPAQRVATTMRRTVKVSTPCLALPLR